MVATVATKLPASGNGSKPLTGTVRAYAAHRGVSHQAVSAAMKAGRLSSSVTRDGRAVTIDFRLADLEWAGSALDQQRPEGASSYAAQRGRREAALAGLAELELARRRGELLSATGLTESLATLLIMVRTRILAAPAQLRSRHPDAPRDLLTSLDELLHAALTDLATGLERVPARKAS
jgi:hypothetical protein